jgi:hypothetical protein
MPYVQSTLPSSGHGTHSLATVALSPPLSHAGRELNFPAAQARHAYDSAETSISGLTTAALPKPKAAEGGAEK